MGPSPDGPDCGDYPDRDRDRFSCLFHGELLPTQAPATTPELSDALPSLVQPKANYSLVFAEEFDGTPTTESCPNEMVTLSSDTWNYDADPRQGADANGVPCGNVADGHYYMAKTSVCRPILTTNGRFDFKYGYIEVKYSVNRESTGSYRNMAMSVGSPQLPLRRQVDRYQISLHAVGG